MTTHFHAVTPLFNIIKAGTDTTVYLPGPTQEPVAPEGLMFLVVDNLEPPDRVTSRSAARSRAGLRERRSRPLTGARSSSGSGIPTFRSKCWIALKQ